MLMQNRTSLSQFLIEQTRANEDINSDLNGLIMDIALACKIIAKQVARGLLANNAPKIGGEINVQGEVQKPLDIISNDIFIERTEWNGHLAAMASEEMENIYQIPSEYQRGKYLLVFDPLDGSSNIDVNISVGSIFSILHAQTEAEPKIEDFLQKGSNQIVAGYSVYGPVTMLVITMGNGTHVFTLDNEVGEFVLTQANVKIPNTTNEFAINASNAIFWEAPVKRYISEVLMGKKGPRGKSFNMRWVGSMVAETHRILTRGGVFLYPVDNKDPKKPSKLRHLYEASPISMIIEQAGGMAINGYHGMLDVIPQELHQRTGIIFGSKEEVELLLKYHTDPNEAEANSKANILDIFG